MAECPDESVWPAIPNFVDGDHVDAATLNNPIQQLAARTEHLLRLLRRIDHATLTVVDAELEPVDGGSTYPVAGQVVYRTQEGTYALALGRAEEDAWFYAAPEAMAVGVVGSKDSGVSELGTVVLCGYISFGDGIPVADVIAADVIARSAPASGRYYLSNIEAGKLTPNPSGPIIYVCDCHISDGKVMSMLVNPQYRDTGESHIHRAFVLDWKPMSRYDVRDGDTYTAYGRLPDEAKPGADGDVSGMLRLCICGGWSASRDVDYTFTLERNGGSDATSWANYLVRCTSSGDSAANNKTISLSELQSASTTSDAPVGSYGMKVRFERPATLSGNTPDQMINDPTRNKWTISMPDAGRGWLSDGSDFKLNLGMYPAMARYVPPVPVNSAALIVNGIELRGPEFPAARRRWYINAADSSGGPWLVWVGIELAGDSVTTPWVHDGNGKLAKERPIVLHVGRMRVGPTGFVTWLQPAKGSPLKITSVLTDSVATQGALQIDMDIDFKSENGDAPGSQVVKRIDGTTFVTGPVVERVVPGPGLSVNQEQGIVRLSVSNAIYAGDFETIALRNAKQDLAGGVFPYTKLLGWGTGTNIASGFTAKFRVPDHIPYNPNRGYWVVVSASVFGEEASGSDSAASFELRNYTLGDQACTPDADGGGTFNGSIADPDEGAVATIGVPFANGYSAFDPVLVHGFRNVAGVDGPGTLVLPDTAQRKAFADLWLKDAHGNPIVVYPGYFVGLSIQRCATNGTPYTGPIGFMSLRWNLVEVPETT